MDVEFVDESAQPADGRPDDLPDNRGRRRLPRWGVVLAVAALGAAGVVVALQRHDAAPASPPAVAASFIPHPASPADPSLPTSVKQLDEPLQTIYLRAVDTAPAHDVLRGGSDTGSCKPVRIGTAPQRVAAQALRRALPGYRILDIARTIDQSAGLCGFQIRARSADGTVAVMVVNSPSSGQPCCGKESLAVGTTPLRTFVIEYARFSTPDGWSVVLGTTGPPGRQPATQALENLVISPALRW